MKSWLIFLIVATTISSCKFSRDKKLFSSLDNSGIDFTNHVSDNKSDNTITFRNFYNGGGVAVGDINNDGLPDVVMTSNQGANKIYLNKGQLKFRDITPQSGFKDDQMWSTGVVMVDINGDGWLDIYICNSGHMNDGLRRNKLYINNHDLTFTESAAKYHLDFTGYATQVSFFDYDGDGDLDCFLINNSPVPINQLNFSNNRDVADSLLKIPANLKGGGDHLYRNDNGVYHEVTRAAGIHGGLISFGLGVSVADINGDGWPDVFVSNDSYERDYLYINQKNGTFKDEMEDWFGHTSFSSMGADIADINNDGNPDIFTTDMLPEDNYRLKTMGAFDNISLFNAKLKSGFYYQYPKNCLQLNNGSHKFVDIARYSGVAATDWSWGALMFDMDNDGLSDLMVCNGINRDITNLDFMDFFANDVLQDMAISGKKYEMDKLLKIIPQTPQQKKIYRNDGNLHFTDIGRAWGFDKATFSNGAAYGDLDNDGDLDIIINNMNEVCSVYKNNSRQLNKNNYLAVSLKGAGKNTFAVGAKVQLFVGDQVFTRELFPSRGFQSSVDYKLFFGLGKISKVDSLLITWPDRTLTTLLTPKINQTHYITQSEVPARPVIMKQSSLQVPYFTEIKNHFKKHEEDEYEDFYAERGVPRLLSKEGPKAAVGDVNGDGMMDIYIGGSKRHPGQMYLQNKQGRFVESKQKAFEPFFSFEDVAVLFFDCDRDGDLDLLIGSGGNTMPLNPYQLQIRLFKNDGKGNFTLETGAFPNTEMNISVAIANDINGDGFPDLFVGSRSVPGQYGKSPRSYVFVNDGHGHFHDVAAAGSPQLARVGMVTGAVWADVVGDSKKELVVVGEWMTPRIFSFKNTHIDEIKTNLTNLYGWWQTVSVADLNRDGKNDLILGNIGENFYLKPTVAHPVKLWLNDFDQNGDTDKIITYYEQGKDLPVALKHDLEDQLPIIKKNNLRHEKYATQSIQELFSKDLISKSVVKTFNYPSSCVALNEGNSNFHITKLPTMSQMSCINVVSVADVNEDELPDLIVGGNQFGFLPQFERLDGCFGDILVNKGRGAFEWQKPAITGLNMHGEMRDIVSLKTAGGNDFIFLQNNEYPKQYRLNRLKDKP